MLRTLASFLKSATAMSSPPPTSTVAKRVPIPKHGVDYRGKVVLAPMVRSGELPSRLLALKYGADLVWGPETIDRSIIGSTRKFNPTTSTIDYTRTSQSQLALPPEMRTESTLYSIHPALESKHLIFQLGTASPTLAVQAAQLIAADVAGIDVNAGCPKPFSTAGGMGAALLKTPDLLCAILEALVANISPVFHIGISVKIRLLHDPADTEALVRRLVRTGITALTVHCRTTPMRPRERAIRDQLRMIVAICHDAGVACVVNGDVADRAHALALMAEYGADGAMIATAAEKNPSVFRPVADGGVLPWRVVAAEYIRTAMRVGNKWGNTKYLLQQIVPGKERAYKDLMPCRCYAAAVEVLRGHAGDGDVGGNGDVVGEADVQLAAQTDALLGIPYGRASESKTEKKARIKDTRAEYKRVAAAYALSKGEGEGEGEGGEEVDVQEDGGEEQVARYGDDTQQQHHAKRPSVSKEAEAEAEAEDKKAGGEAKVNISPEQDSTSTNSTNSTSEHIDKKIKLPPLPASSDAATAAGMQSIAV
ncbi:FMN-linked oxidoreductase [Pseudovirgaria hyperparasitica]|uniref:FMN-linked oxidoreductase n=1 Tax=Pseudovirgaria hyperparasitica TaxID=470096 RepID=A0A6A6VWD7_9PEZI|nr:FMN-linked oxidoreductase [Pseudovirgaria hyperparasitica]KAF2754106.1 FMN-linked oxidoreductase [Pseudovirgaria hyperparasitica]